MGNRSDTLQHRKHIYSLIAINRKTLMGQYLVLKRNYKNTR